MPGIEPGAFHMQSERATTALHPLLITLVSYYLKNIFFQQMAVEFFKNFSWFRLKLLQYLLTLIAIELIANANFFLSSAFRKLAHINEWQFLSDQITLLTKEEKEKSFGKKAFREMPNVRFTFCLAFFFAFFGM